jgi:predicted anti-sigma-YlaC factor YlaD
VEGNFPAELDRSKETSKHRGHGKAAKRVYRTRLVLRASDNLRLHEVLLQIREITFRIRHRTLYMDLIAVSAIIEGVLEHSIMLTFMVGTAHEKSLRHFAQGNRLLSLALNDTINQSIL